MQYHHFNLLLSEWKHTWTLHPLRAIWEFDWKKSWLHSCHMKWNQTHTHTLNLTWCFLPLIVHINCTRLIKCMLLTVWVLCLTDRFTWNFLHLIRHRWARFLWIVLNAGHCYKSDFFAVQLKSQYFFQYDASNKSSGVMKQSKIDILISILKE